ncbi:MAG: hypothetical protein V4515_14735 [Chloroflexota bacterium]
MNLTDVAEEIAARLDTIDGLKCWSYPPKEVTSPCAVVLNPEPGALEYDATYGRGMDRMTLPVLVVVGRADEHSAHKRVRAYCDGSGPKSIKAVLESGTYTSLHTLRVSTAGIDGVVWSKVDYYAALFDIDITGQGSA